jgi:hypothetical protein
LYLERNAGAGRLWNDRRGAVFVEFLIAFLPVYMLFLCLIQLTILFTSRLVTEHAAVHAARAAAVVFGDDPAEYGDSEQEMHQVTSNGKRAATVRKAVILTLAPLILTGLVEDVEVLFPDPDTPEGPDQTDSLAYTPMGESTVHKVRTRVEVTVACRIGFANKIACAEDGFFSIGTLLGSRYTRRVRAEAMYPYQGARYAY